MKHLAFIVIIYILSTSCVTDGQDDTPFDLLVGNKNDQVLMAQSDSPDEKPPVVHQFKKGPISALARCENEDVNHTYFVAKENS